MLSFPARPRSVLAVPVLLAAAAVAARTGADTVKDMPPAALDRTLMAEVKDHNEVMKNLQHLSDVIGPRLTGSNSSNAPTTGPPR
jgi:hypothetical protein